MTTLQLGVLLAVFMGVVAAVLVIGSLTRPDRARDRLRTLVGVDAGAAWGSRFLQALAAAARPLSKLAAPEEGVEQSSVKLRLAHAGIRHRAAPTVFFGLKTLFALGLPLIALVLIAGLGLRPGGLAMMFVLLLLATLGYYGPNLVLARWVENRQREIFESFPDALDLMLVCVEAGLGTESAMVRVSEDLQFNSPALAEELRLVNLELQAGGNRERALHHLAIRTGVDEVDSFVSMINQSERFGTSIAASLRVHSRMLRTRRRQKAEETAAKIGLKLLFPLIFCIFPALLVVLVGPAGIQIGRMLSAMAGEF